MSKELINKASYMYIDKGKMLCINILILGVLALLFKNFSVFLIGGICAVTLIYSLNKQVYKTVLIIVCINILAMISLYYGYIFMYDTPYFVGGSDDKIYEHYARILCENNIFTFDGIREIPELRSHNSIGYIWVLAILMKISSYFGEFHTILPRILNIYIYASICLMVYKYVVKNKYIKEKNARYLMLFLGIFPNAVFVNIHTFRDTINVFIIFSIFYMWDNFFYSSTSKKIGISLATVILTYFSIYIREMNVIYILFILLLSFIFKDNNIKVRVKWVAILGVIGILIFSIKIPSLISYIVNYYETYKNIITGTSDGLSTMIFTLPLFPLGIVARIAYGLMNPFPGAALNIFSMGFNISTLSDVLISMGTIIQIMGVPYLIMGLKKLDKVSICFIIIYLSIIMTTFTFRHFVLVYPFMFIIIFRKYFDIDIKKRKKIFSIMSVVLLGSGIIYMLLKLFIEL